MEVDFKGILQPVYSVFANKVIHYLKYKYGCEYDHDSHVTECQFFTYDIGEAVITISNILRGEYRKMFSSLLNSLKNRSRFEEYCMLIPVVKDEIYFYNFLKRISLIFELAKYCYDSNVNGSKEYFEIAIRCIENYPDLLYFNTVGGWECLKHTASLLAKIGRPLQLIMSEDISSDENIQTFPEAYRELRKIWATTGNFDMIYNDGMECLDQLSEAFSGTSSPESVLVSGNEILRNYFVNMCAKFPEDDGAKCSKYESSVSLSEKKSLLFNQLSEVLYRATGIIKDLSKNFESQMIELYGNDGDTLEEKPINTQGDIMECNVPNIDEPSISTATFGQIVDSGTSRADVNVRNTCVKDSGLLEEVPNDESTDSRSPRNVDVRSSDIKIAVTPQEEVCSALKGTEAVGMEWEAGPSTTKAETYKPGHIPAESSGDHEMVSEAGSSLAGAGEDIKYSFIVPPKYLRTDVKGYSDECKYFYSARIDPPSRKEKMTKRLKEMLDANLKKNSRVMTSGDLFVSPPGSSQEETLFVFVDSSTDEEGDEDLDRLICRIKKYDLEYDSEKDNLKAKKPATPSKISSKRQSPKASTSSSESEQKPGRKLKRGASADAPDKAPHIRYLSKLYKRNLPLILDAEERYRTFALSLSNLPEKSTIYVINAALISKRKIDLAEERQCDDLLCLLEDFKPVTRFAPMSLPLQKDRKLNAYIRNYRYSNIYNDVFVAGEFAYETEVWYIFAPNRQDMPVEEYNREALRMAESYVKAVNEYDLFCVKSRLFMASVIQAINRLTMRLDV